MDWKDVPSYIRRPPGRPYGVHGSAIDRLFKKIVYDHGCWTFTGGKKGGGYSYAYDGATRRHVPGHRLVYEHLVGPIPDGLVLDHLCRNPRCINPIHLEPVTNEENVRRGASCRSTETSCTKGHPFTPENTGSRWYGGQQWRFCKVCKRELQAHARAEKRWKRLPWSDRADNGANRTVYALSVAENTDKCG
jgi:hypothetical protein